MGEDSPSEEEFRFHTVGEQLKAERERQGLSLSDMAAKTRVPMRHLDSIEKSDFGALPGTTYTLGFARSYARAVGMDAAKVSADMRAELAQGGHEGYQAPTQNYEPADPARVPSRTLAWTAAAIGVLAVAGLSLLAKHDAWHRPCNSRALLPVATKGQDERRSTGDDDLRQTQAAKSS